MYIYVYVYTFTYKTEKGLIQRLNTMKFANRHIYIYKGMITCIHIRV